MKNKFIVLLSLLVVFFPLTSQAFALPPSANLTIVVNTQGQDSSFHFDITYGSNSNPVFSNYQQFDLQTQGLSATKTQSLVAFPGEEYAVTQDGISGLTIDSVQCVSDNQADIFSYTPDGVLFSPTARENIVCTFDDVVPKTPVLIVPGLLGTELSDGNNLLWADLNRMFIDPTDSFMDSLGFNNDLSASSHSIVPTDVIKNLQTAVGLVNFDYTSSLFTEFESQGYVENQTLFTFPYDWRYGASGKFLDGTTNSDLLGQKIQSILAQTGSSKIDVVAHSEGGLIVKKYVMDHPADNDIDKAVFVGVPSTGAPDAVKILLEGDNFGIPFLSQDEIKKIAVNMPVAYDLSPSQQYYNNQGSFVTVTNEGVLGSLTSETSKDLNEQDFESFLTADHGLNSQALTGAENLHTADFDNFDMRTAGVDVYAIDGCKTGTLGKIIEDRFSNVFGQNFTEYKRPKFVPGDNTVPFESSTNLPMDDANKYYLLDANHSNMLTQDGSREEIVNLISGSNLNVNSKFITQDITQCKLNGKAISIFSPLNIFVTDQDGNTLGIASDGSVVNAIPNADFEIFGEHKFLYLPTDDGQTYTININGTGTGTFTINSQDITNGEVSDTQTFSDIPVTPDLTGQINLGDLVTPTTLSIDGQGTAILASANINAAESQDFTPPTSVATLTGAQDSLGNYTGNVDVGIAATDAVIVGQESATSGVLDVEYSLDGADSVKVAGDSADVAVSTQGAHTISFFATDNSGNNEATQTTNFTIEIPVPVVVTPVVLSPPVNSPAPVANSSSGGGGGVALLIQNQKSVNSAPVISPVFASPIILPVPVAPIIAPVIVVKKTAKVLVVKKTSNVAIAKIPAKIIVAKNTPPKTTQNKNIFLSSLSDIGAWLWGFILHK